VAEATSKLMKDCGRVVHTIVGAAGRSGNNDAGQGLKSWEKVAGVKALLDSPMGVAIDGARGTIYVCNRHTVASVTIRAVQVGQFSPIPTLLWCCLPGCRVVSCIDFPGLMNCTF